MRILHVSNGGIPLGSRLGGGTERYITGLAKYQAKSGHDVLVLDRKHSKTDSAIKDLEGFRILRLNVRRFHVPFGGNPRLFELSYRVKFALDTILYALICRLWIAGKSFDVIHIHEPLVGIVLLPFNRSVQRRTLFTQHGVSFASSYKSIEAIIYNPLRIFVMRHVEKVISLNPSARVQFMRETGLSRDRIEFIPTGVDIDEVSRLNLNPEVLQMYGLPDKIILFVGRITEQKGLATLVQAGQLLISESVLVGFAFVFVGPSEQFDTKEKSGSYHDSLRKTIVEYRLSEYFRFLGALPREDVFSLISRCKIFVLPSLIENQPLVIPEVMLFGKPVIASRLPGTLVEIRDGQNGLLFEAGNAPQLALAIRSILGNSAWADEMGRSAQEFVRQQLNMEHLTTRIIRAYADVMMPESSNPSTNANHRGFRQYLLPTQNDKSRFLHRTTSLRVKLSFTRRNET